MANTTGKKWGGRKKGTPNKRTLNVADKLAELGYDPLESLVRLAIDAQKEGDKVMEFQASKELAQYVAPKRKAMEITSDNSHLIVIENDLSRLQRDNLKKLL
jgi:5'-3' exonuclease